MNEDDEPPLLHAFEAYGIELEYMIVDRESLSVLPAADRLLSAGPGDGHAVEHGNMGWSNEFVLHVVEIKNLRPVPSLAQLPHAFHDEVCGINRLLDSMDAMLMPGAMHPWMDPRSETRLWPHEHDEIYQAYARIFNTRSHGWANLQSMHVNLPFADDAEFARLHAAVRLLLPVLPALAASSPFADGRATGCADYRMRVYSDNAGNIPSIAGMVVPETVSTRSGYHEHILKPMYRDIAPYDPDGLLQQEWLNSRGAIARFDRNAIEIRVIDTQECPRADLAIAAAVAGVVRMLYQEPEQLVRQQEMSGAGLTAILQDCVRDAERAVIADAEYLRLLGYPGRRCSAEDLWRHLARQLCERDGSWEQQWMGTLETMLDHGPLARRLLRATGERPDREQLAGVYRQLCACLREDLMFLPR